MNARRKIFRKKKRQSDNVNVVQNQRKLMSICLVSNRSNNATFRILTLPPNNKWPSGSSGEYIVNGWKSQENDNLPLEKFYYIVYGLTPLLEIIILYKLRLTG